MVRRMKFLAPFASLLLLAGCAASAPPPITAKALVAAPSEQPAGKAIVSAADPRAAAAGRAMLARGGSAADAAVATLVALTVVEPQSSGIGGGSFTVYHDAATGRLETIDGRETAPAGARPDLFLGPDGKPMPFREAVAGGRSVGVPGNIRAMAALHARRGKLRWAEVLAPAIALARDGFTITPRLRDALVQQQAVLAGLAEALALYYQPDGTAKPVGSTVRNPRLAAFLTAVASHGPDAAYRGAHADRLAAAVLGARNPSTMTVADIAAYQAKDRPPVCGSYRSYRICGMGPPSSGGIAVYGILKMLERFDLASLGKDDPRAWHLIAESMRLAYADRAQWIGDPDFVAVPVEGLTSDAYLAARSALIFPDRAMTHVEPGMPAGARRLASVPDTEVAGTSHFAVADAAGNVASVTSTVESSFGSKLVVDGYVLNNELTDFDFVPQKDGLPSANRVEPGKRPRSSMSPTIVYGPDGRVVLAVGAAGGPTIIAQTAKAIIGVVDWKLSVQEAIALPVIMGVGDEVRVEQGTWLAAMADRLRAFGHKVEPFAAPFKANGIERVEGGWRGGADPRSEGRALGL